MQRLNCRLQVLVIATYMDRNVAEKCITPCFLGENLCESEDDTLCFSVRYAFFL